MDGGVLFVLGNWVGLDCLAPQAFGLALSLGSLLVLALRPGGDQGPAAEAGRLARHPPALMPRSTGSPHTPTDPLVNDRDGPNSVHGSGIAAPSGSSASIGSHRADQSGLELACVGGLSRELGHDDHAPFRRRSPRCCTYRLYSVVRRQRTRSLTAFHLAARDASRPVRRSPSGSSRT